METVQGKAHNIRQHARLITQENNLESAYNTIMTVDGRPVSLNTDDPVFINEGDTVIVAGTNRGGALRAYAYRNMTNGASGGSSRLKYLIAASVATIVALVMFGVFGPELLSGTSTEDKLLAFVGGTLGTGLVGFVWYLAIQSVRAHAAVK